MFTLILASIYKKQNENLLVDSNSYQATFHYFIVQRYDHRLFAIRFQISHYNLRAEQRGTTALSMHHHSYFIPILARFPKNSTPKKIRFYLVYNGKKTYYI